MRASFFESCEQNSYGPKTLDLAYQIARSVLNIETNEQKTIETFKLSHTHFMHIFFTRESAFALAHLMLENVARPGQDGNARLASREEMKEFISYFVTRMFPGEASPSTIGVGYAFAFENLVYDTCACIVRRFVAMDPKSKRFSSNLELLRRCVRMVARLCSAVQDYLPYCDDTKKCEWTTLCTILEFAEGSVLNEPNCQKESKLNFLILFDEICSNIIQRDSSDSANMRWAACSTKLGRVLRRAKESPHFSLLKACIEFKDKSDELRGQGTKKRSREDDAGMSNPDTPELGPCKSKIPKVEEMPSFEL
jgi:hypothetical protein